MSPRKILVAGYYGYGNLGDEAILASVLANVRRLRPDSRFTVLSGDPESTARRHQVAAFFLEDFECRVKAVRESDLVILGGGGLFQDHWPVDVRTLFSSAARGLALYAEIPLLAAMFGRPCALYAVGIGPLSSPTGRWLTRVACSVASVVTVRDGPSRRLLEESGLRGEEGMAWPLVTADPAFSLVGTHGAEADRWLDRLGVPNGRPLIGVNVRPWDRKCDPARWQEACARALDAIVTESGAHVLFLPFQDRGAHADDVQAARAVVRRMRTQGQAWVSPVVRDPSLARGLLARCQKALVMRYHAALFGLQAGVPVVALAYDPKVEALMAQVGAAEASLSLSDWTAKAIVASLCAVEQVWDAEAVADRLEELSRLSQETAGLALSALDAPRPSPAPDAQALIAIGKDYIETAFRVAAAERQVLRWQRRHKLLRRAYRRLQAQMEEAGRLVRTLRDQLDRLLAERDALATELEGIRGTLGYRALALFWRTMARLFPEGSLRRRVYRRCRLGLGAGLRRLRRRWRRYRDLPDGGQGAGPWLLGAPEPEGLLLERQARRLREAFMEWERLLRTQSKSMVVCMLSATRPDPAEGQRPTHLAAALAHKGIGVLFGYWRWGAEFEDPGLLLDQGILTAPLDLLQRERGRWLDNLPVSRRVIWIAFPHPGFFRIFSEADAAGWITVYDILDDWAAFREVGQAPWYDANFERHLVGAADLLLAVSDRLSERIQSRFGRRPKCLPNGVDLEKFKGVRPVTGLLRGEVTLGYFGHLSAAWFDWEMVRAVAERRPAWRIYLIGYGEEAPPWLEQTPNVVLLGKRGPEELAPLAASWDVAIAPFRPGDLAQAVDAIKVYEYLALGLPVVVTGIHPPPGAGDFVRSVDGPDAFIAGVEAAAREAKDEGARRRRQAYASACTWDRRVDALLKTLERDPRVRLKEFLGTGSVQA